MHINGLEFNTYKDIIDYALSLNGPAQADFVKQYRQTSEFALRNIGYMTGYYDVHTAQEIRRIFHTTHPIFGDTHPPAETAFQMDVDAAKKELGA